MSEEDSLYPPPDVSYFEGQPETVFAYLSVEGLPAGEDIEARFERIGTGSILSLPLGKRGGLEVLDEREDHLRKGENGPAGVAQFELKTGSGPPVPPGKDTVALYDLGGEGAAAARKFFVIEG